MGTGSLLGVAGEVLRSARPKQIVLSGPSGFLGSRVLQSILDVHQFRKSQGMEPGEAILLSSSPGNLMSRLHDRYGSETLSTVRASRVDYYHQHQVDSWHDQLGSMGVGGHDAVFVNLAAMAGPVPGKPDAMMAVNYAAPMAAARACEALGFGHWIQSSTQATKAERSGQVPYSRWKAMCDFSLTRLEKLPVSVTVLGLLYCKEAGIVGQRGNTLNMVDLSLLPLTPIMGDGSAPLQPLEVGDAADRIAFLALSEARDRPSQGYTSKDRWASPNIAPSRQYTLRFYDAVGPETMSMLEMQRRFASLNGRTLRPVHVDYRNFELVLNVASLGNLNRQFVSLLRSEQDSKKPIVGKHEVFERLLGPQARLTALNESLLTGRKAAKPRSFPWMNTITWMWRNWGVIPPGMALVAETLLVAFFGPTSGPMWTRIRLVWVGAVSSAAGVVTAATVVHGPGLAAALAASPLGRLLGALRDLLAGG